MTDLAQFLTQIRVTKGLSQKDLAQAIGVDPSFVGHVERGARVPRLEILERWLQACGARMDLVGPSGPDPLDALSTDERMLVEAYRKVVTADANDRQLRAALLQELAQVLPGVVGQSLAMLAAQVDAIKVSQSSIRSDEGEARTEKLAR